MRKTQRTIDPSDLAGGTGLQTEGKFHFIVIGITDGKETPSSFLNGLFVKLKVVHGEHKDETFNLDLLDGKMDSKDGGEFAYKKQIAFLIAANVLSIEQASVVDAEYDEQASVGSQVIAELRLGREASDGKRYLELHYANVYHVDDPRADSVPKCAETLACIPASMRHDANWFDPILGRRKPKTSSSPATAEAAPNFEGI
jgi:hypothetical protein